MKTQKHVWHRSRELENMKAHLAQWPETENIKTRLHLSLKLLLHPFLSLKLYLFLLLSLKLYLFLLLKLKLRLLLHLKLKLRLLLLLSLKLSVGSYWFLFFFLPFFFFFFFCAVLGYSSFFSLLLTEFPIQTWPDLIFLLAF